jgi:hypothetical protein
VLLPSLEKELKELLAHGQTVADAKKNGQLTDQQKTALNKAIEDKVGCEPFALFCFIGDDQFVSWIVLLVWCIVRSFSPAGEAIQGGHEDCE